MGVIEQARKFPASIFADVAGRRGALNGRIRALAPTMRIAGSALTVEVRPGDNLMIHAAIALAQPGDVLVIDGKGDLSSALMGTIMMNACRQVGIAAVVMDGAVRERADGLLLRVDRRQRLRERGVRRELALFDAALEVGE